MKCKNYGTICKGTRFKTKEKEYFYCEDCWKVMNWGKKSVKPKSGKE